MAVGLRQGKGGGPKTEEGKRRASLNAMKHGFNAEAPHALEALDFEPGVEFRPILRKARGYFRPANPMEEELVHLIARCWWKRARIEQLEDRSIERNPYKLLPVNTGSSLLKYTRQVDLQLHRALRALQSLRKCKGT
ncbi:MAG: hypothetical protein Q7T82_21565 [Armatimonadota bacterium]|nr:hypothetical protein [Armatimonadota bacterium]